MVVWDEGARVRSRCELGIFLWSDANTAPPGIWTVFWCWRSSTEGQVIPDFLFPLSVCSPCLSSSMPLSRRRQSWSKRGQNGHLLQARVYSGVALAHQYSRLDLICYLYEYHQQRPPLPCSDVMPDLIDFIPYCCLSSSMTALALVGSHTMEREALKWTLNIDQSTPVAILGKWPESQAVSICFFHLVSGARKHMCSLQSLSFPKPCCQLHGFSSQPRKLVFPVLDSRTVVDMWFKLLTPQRGFLSPCNLSPLSVPS